MKIVQMLLSPRIGGAESLAAALQEFWRTQGVDSEIRYLDEREGSRSRLERIRAVRRAYHELGPDLVLSHSALPNAYCRLALPPSVPVVPVLHSSADDFASRSLRFSEHIFRVLRRDHIIAVSNVARSLYEKHFGDSPNLHVVQNGISDPGYVLSTDIHCKKIATLARVSSVKNPWLWTEVVSHFSRLEKALDFDWIGPIDNDPSIRSLVDGFEQSSQRRNFLGGRPNGSASLLDYDLYFHPSDREALSISILEAVMCGLPVVCSDTVAESVGADLVSETFAAGNAASAIEAVERAAASYHEHSLRAHVRRRQALEKYGIENAGRGYLDVFARVVHSQ